MAKFKESKELRERMRKSESITEEERKFVREMDGRMPSLSVRHNAERAGKGGEPRLDESYVRKFRRK